jgi:hypothetical protein
MCAGTEAADEAVCPAAGAAVGKSGNGREVALLVSKTTQTGQATLGRRQAPAGTFLFSYVKEKLNVSVSAGTAHRCLAYL